MVASIATASSVTLPACPVCGANSWTEPPVRTRLRWCRGCGTVLNDRSTSRAEEESRYDAYTDAPNPDEDRVARAQWAWLKQELGLQPSVLDIGCGHGAFLLAAQADGATVAGVELDPAGAESCVRRGLAVRRGSFFDVGVPPGPWSLITMWDVLEHLELPRLALQTLAAELAPGGVFVLRGRNAAVHAPFKKAYNEARPFLTSLRVPDVSCVHRWGFDGPGYARLLTAAGLIDIRLYPGLPTPGDRSQALGGAAGAIKGALRGAGMALHGASGRKLYPFPSVLISARKPETR